MSLTVDLIRWYIAKSPLTTRKRALGRWAERRLDRTLGPRVYDQIAGVARMELDLAQEYDRAIYLNLVDATSLRVLRRVLRPGDTLVDAGANVGLFTVVASRLVGPAGRIYAFEPQPMVAQRLRRNISINAPANATVFEQALWHEPAELRMHLFEGCGTCTASVGCSADRGVREEFSVQTVRLDDVVAGPVRLIKMDVEGADWNALRGAERLLSASPPPHLILEVNDAATQTMGYRAMEMVDWLLAKHPCRMTLLERKRMRNVDRDGLNERVENQPGDYFNLWLH